MKVIDADAHVEECPTTWEFLDAEFRGRKPLPLTFPENTLDGIYSAFNAVWLIEGNVRPRHTAAASTCLPPRPCPRRRSASRCLSARRT